MDSNEIRLAFLKFFEERGHTIVPSSSLIPHNDPTLFFVNAGMVQFKDVFTGAEKRDYSRAVSVQKCLRVSGKHNDLDNVGRTPRHHTFFEMLGNFSFGDYFKSDAVPMAWDLLTERLKIDAERLWVTIYEDDDEAFSIWRDKVGFPESRIQRLGAKENFWSMGEFGPCGPCSEIHYDHGERVSSDTRGPAGEDDRYVEIWNNVFMQFEQTTEGRFDLPRPSIDTGMGLERVTAVLQGVYSNYDTDLFQPLIRKAADVAGLTYGENDEADTALRVIADHSRAAAFLVGDGVMPMNTDRGYVLRRIMRRAIRFGVKIGIDRPFLHETVLQVVADLGDAYPELKSRAGFLEEVVHAEEERFRRTLDRGMRLLDTELERVGTGGEVPGDIVFKMADTYGFPYDLTELIAEERSITVDKAGYDAASEEQKARGRLAWKGSGEEAVGQLWQQLAEEVGSTVFTGYDRDNDVATIAVLIKQTDGESARVEQLESGDRGIVIVDKTPFYAESGGQVGDVGKLGSCRVTDTQTAAGLSLHHVVVKGTLAVGDLVQAHIDGESRDKTRRNHTATHLMHAALREILGDHVTQKGSLVGPNRLRFDFSHHKPLKAKQIRRIEKRVNGEILRNTAVNTELKSLDAAVADGAMALFGEKYASDVRVVSVPGFSVELCGGTHCTATGDIGLLTITQETGVAAGVRRIEAQTGTGALDVAYGNTDVLAAAADRLKSNPEQVLDAIGRLLDDRKRLEKEIKRMQIEVAKDAAGDMLQEAREIAGIKVLAVQFDGDLREQADRLRDQLGTSLVILAGASGSRVQLLVAATRDIAGSRVHAGNMVKEIAPLIGGGGGGRPDMAQAGGKNAAGIPAALERAYSYAAEILA